MYEWVFRSIWLMEADCFGQDLSYWQRWFKTILGESGGQNIESIFTQKNVPVPSCLASNQGQEHLKSVRFASVSVFETTFKFIFQTWLRFAFLSAFRRSVWSRSLAQMQHHIWGGGTLRCQTLKLTIYQEIGLIYQSELLGVTIKKRNLQYIVPMKWVSAFSMHCPESS